jgi:integrase
MANEYVTVAAILFTSKTLSNGEHPIMIRVTKNRVRRYVSLGISCKVGEWDKKKNLPSRSHPQRDFFCSIISKNLDKYNDRIIAFKQEDTDYTPDILISESANKLKKTTLFNFITEKVASLKKSGQMGNANVYNDLLGRLKVFTAGRDLSFAQVDYSFLLRLETDFRSRGNTDNAMSVRFRTLRAVFNLAIDEGYVKREKYPFDKFKVNERFGNKTKKRAITKDDIRKIALISKIGEQEIKTGSAIFEAQKYFLFSYFCQGINFVDIANLKWSNLINGRIFYKRAKTGGELSFKLQQPALDIIEFWRPVTKTSNDAYLFPILDTKIHLTPSQKHNRIHKVLTRVNRDLKAIGKELKIETLLTSYVARHTFATVLKQSGVPTAIISESMGHKTEAITQTYLKEFENNIIDDAMVNLL